MQEHAEVEFREARRIVDGLLESGEPALDDDTSLAISDIQADTADFVADVQLLEDVGADMPAVRLGKEDLIPVALSFFAGAGWPWAQPSPSHVHGRWRGHPLFREWTHMALGAAWEDRRRIPGIESISREQARETFRNRATEFLATRIVALRGLHRAELRWPGLAVLNMLQRAGGPRIPTPGCHFSVSTNSPGLRVFWSGAYRVSPNYFSHPTSPTVGVLQTGTYVFGVDGGAYGNLIQWDLAAVVVLPGTPHAHLNY
jgi:hypothetical protein